MNLILSRVGSWCGVQVKINDPVTRILLRDKTIARFPSGDMLEVVLCGSIKHHVLNDPEFLPEGAWTHKDAKSLLVDLTQPGGLEEAFRVLLNAYIMAERPEAQDWWLSEEHLAEDPTCERIAEVIAQHRDRIAAESRNDAEWAVN